MWSPLLISYSHFHLSSFPPTHTLVVILSPWYRSIGGPGWAIGFPLDLRPRAFQTALPWAVGSSSQTSVLLHLYMYILLLIYIFYAQMWMSCPRRTVHCPTCSTGIRWNLSDSARVRWTQFPDFVIVTRAKLAYLVREESSGVRWNLAYSDGVCRFRPDISSSLVHQTPPTGLSPIYSTGLSPWIPPNSVQLRL